MHDETANLRERLTQQEAVIEELRERLDRLDGGPGPGTARRAEPASLVAGGRTTDRRHLLSGAATAAAGAVVGGAALALGQASPAGAITANFSGSPAINCTADPNTQAAIVATTASGRGLAATATTGEAVFGLCSSGTGVYGESSANGEGVFGRSVSGIAVEAITGTGVGVVAESQRTQLLLRGSPTPPPSSAVSREGGSIVRDGNGDVWLCTSGGTPGVWRKLAGPTSAGAFHLLAVPKRVYDSRPGFEPVGVGTKAPLVPGWAREIDLKANGSGVPTKAVGVLVSVVATNTTGGGGGFLAIYRNGVAWPGTSNLNWSGPDQSVAVTTVTGVDPVSWCALYASETTDVVVDVLGYYL
ncbi:MAG: hypothetical protein MUF83_01025 [Acidimicrobiales bacterium]|jgi:hypothetical protein|nr:hypothetical protein [Acidimicrobiales bacterium]